VLSSIRIGRNDTGKLCGGLSLEVQARAAEDDEITLVLPITNGTDDPWRGTVSVVIGSTTIPVDIGEIPAGETRQDSIAVDLDEGTTEVNGSLLIGP
jgi:hypothetical protein